MELTINIKYDFESFNLYKKSVNSTSPIPYIGINGPYIKPYLFIKYPFLKKTSIISITYPKILPITKIQTS